MPTYLEELREAFNGEYRCTIERQGASNITGRITNIDEVSCTIARSTPNGEVETLVELRHIRGVTNGSLRQNITMRLQILEDEGLL